MFLRAGRFAIVLAAMMLTACGGGSINWETGQIRFHGPTDPATGIRLGEWEFYNRDGTVRARGNYVNGRLSGVWTWFYYTGSPEIELNFVNGVRHGEYKKWEIDGVLRQKGQYLNDKKSGPWTFYSKSSAVLVEMGFLEGKPHGECRIYYTGGKTPQIKTICEFQYGKFNGSHRTFFSDGKPTADAVLDNGKLVTVKGWDVMGILTTHTEAEEQVKKALVYDRELLRKIEEITKFDYEKALRGE